jgi:hypothetical protein
MYVTLKGGKVSEQPAINTQKYTYHTITNEAQHSKLHKQ